MTNQQLAQRIMRVKEAIEASTPETIERALLALEGIKPGCHEGRGPEMDETPAGQRLKLEWFAGQILDIYEHKAWRGVNVWLGMADTWIKPIAEAAGEREV